MRAEKTEMKRTRRSARHRYEVQVTAGGRTVHARLTAEGRFFAGPTPDDLTEQAWYKDPVTRLPWIPRARAYFTAAVRRRLLAGVIHTAGS